MCNRLSCGTACSDNYGASGIRVAPVVVGPLLTAKPIDKIGWNMMSLKAAPAYFLISWRQ
jgi:hypothetical protein